MVAVVSDGSAVYGLGIYRKHSEDEKKKLVGTCAAENAKLIDFDEENIKLLGTTSFKTPVEISKEVMSSDFLITTGNIEYHYFAGYSGGAKALMPGVCSRNSISANHSMMLDDNSSAGNFYTNPVRLDIEEAGAMVGIDYIFNVILDGHKNIIAAVAGKII